MAKERATGSSSTDGRTDGTRSSSAPGVDVTRTGVGGSNPGVAPLVSLLFLIAVAVMLLRRDGVDSSAFEVDTRPAPNRVIERGPSAPGERTPFERDVEEVDGLYYRVKRGDTLEAIAKRFYANPRAWQPIATINRIREPKRLRAGRVIWIPALRMNP